MDAINQSSTVKRKAVEATKKKKTKSYKNNENTDSNNNKLQ